MRFPYKRSIANFAHATPRNRRLWLSSISLTILPAALMYASSAHALSPAIFSSHTHTPSSVDQNGVDLGTGQFVPPAPASSIGDSTSGIAETLSGPEFPNGSQFTGGITIDPAEADNVPQMWANSSRKDGPEGDALVYFGGYRKLFGGTTNALGCIIALDGSMDALCLDPNHDARNPTGGRNTLTTSDGTVVVFQGNMASDFGTDAKYAGLVTITKPDGEGILLTYERKDIPTDADPVDDPSSGVPVPLGTPPANLVQATMTKAQSSLGWLEAGSWGGGAPGFGLGNGAIPSAGMSNGIGTTSDFEPGSVGAQTVGTDINTAQVFVANQSMVKRLHMYGASGDYVIRQTVERRDRYLQTSGGVGGIDHFWNAVTTSNASNEDMYDDPMPRNGGSIYLLSTRYYTDKYTVTYPSGRQTVVDYYTENQHPGAFVDAPEISGNCYTGGTQFTFPLNCVKSVTRGGSTWKYTWGIDQYAAVDIEDPLHHHRRVRMLHTDNCGTFITYDQDDKGRVTTYEPGPLCGQVSKVTYPEGNFVKYTYNGRGDLTQIDTYAKDGVTHTTQSAGYPSTCTLAADPGYHAADPAYSTATDYKVCHQPIWTKDARGNQTDYTYSVDHGGVLTVTYPTDDSGVRAQTRNVYVQVTPKMYDFNGHIENNSPVWRLHCTVTLPSTATSDPNTCATAAQYQVTTYAYADNAQGTNNILMTSTTVSAGDGSLSATTSYGYDAYGDRVWIDGPRTDVDDKSYTTFDQWRRPVFEIGPDPDGAGPLKRQIVHHLYDDDRREYRTETGTGNATDGSDFVISTFKRLTFDDAGRLAKTEVVQP